MLSDFKKNKKKNILHGFLFKLGATLILLVAVLLIFADIKIYQKKKQLNYQIENLKNKVQSLKDENNALSQKISGSGSNEYIEKIAREELDLQKPGEKVVSFITPEKEQTNNAEEKKSIWNNWLLWLGSIFKK